MGTQAHPKPEAGRGDAARGRRSPGSLTSLTHHPDSCGQGHPDAHPAPLAGPGGGGVAHRTRQSPARIPPPSRRLCLFERRREEGWLAGWVLVRKTLTRRQAVEPRGLPPASWWGGGGRWRHSAPDPGVDGMGPARGQEEGRRGRRGHEAGGETRKGPLPPSSALASSTPQGQRHRHGGGGASAPQSTRADAPLVQKRPRRHTGHRASPVPRGLSG